MADDLDLDLEQLDQQIDNTNKVENRIKDLSQKVKLTSDERDELSRLNTEKDATIASKDKEIEFLSNFPKMVAKYPSAAEYQDQIKDKISKGYSDEDAVISVLNAEGKLNAGATPTAPALQAGEVAGGSAANQPNMGTAKTLDQMTREEKRAALEEAVARGDISLS